MAISRIYVEGLEFFTVNNPGYFNKGCTRISPETFFNFFPLKSSSGKIRKYQKSIEIVHCTNFFVQIF